MGRGVRSGRFDRGHGGLKGLRLQQQIRSRFAVDSGQLRLDLAQIEQGLQGLQIYFFRIWPSPSVSKSRSNTSSRKALSLTLTIEKRSKAQSAARCSSSRVQAKRLAWTNVKMSGTVPVAPFGG